MLHPFLDAPAPLAFAHRGGAADGDENTTDAFGRAVAMGYRHIETDVHASADGVPVVIHDPDLRRMAGTDARIADLTWAELRTVRIAGESVLPRLDEVLDAFPETRFNIEAKADAVVAPALDAVRRTGSVDRVLLGSFNDARLARVRALGGPRLATSLGQRSIARLWAASLAGVPLRLPPSAVAAQIPVRHGPVTVLNTRFLAYLHRLGLAVHVWTVDDPKEIVRLLDMGVDGIMTDRIGVLRDVYAARGSWVA